MNNIEKIELLEHIAIAYKDDETINNELVSPQGKFIKNKELAEAIENLIQENKELKEKCKELIKEKQELTTIIEDDCIPKSKVKELAKKYEFVLNDYDSSTADYKHSQNIGKYMACIELLKEGE